MTPGDKDRDQRHSGRVAVAWGLFWFVMAAILWFVTCGDPAIAESPYESGDTLQVHVEAMDSSGFAFLPDSAWVEVFRHGAVKETLAYGPDFSQITGQNILEATYVLPSSWSAPFDLLFSGKYTSTTKGNGQLLVSPSRVRVNPNLPTVTLTATTTDVTNAVTTSGGTIDNVTLTATTTDVTNAVSVDSVRAVGTAYLLDEAFPTFTDSVRAVGTAYLLDEAFPTFTDSVRAVGTAYLLDEEITVSSIDSVRAVGTVAELTEEIVASVAAVDSLTPSALGDLWAGIATGTATIIDSSDCTACGVYTSGGTKVSGAPVYITGSSTFSAMSDVVGFGWSVTGNYNIRVPALPGVADTFYVWAYQQGSYTVSAAQVIVTD